MRRDSSEDEPVVDDGGLAELFGSDNFREYDDSNPFVAPPTGHPGGGAETRAVGAVGTAAAAAAPAAAAPAAAPVATASTVATAAPAASAVRAAGARLATWWGQRTRAQRQTIIGASAGAALVIVFVALFAVGSAIGRGIGPDAAASGGQGPQALGPGVYAWSELKGGECVEPFGSVWAEEFTVVECDEPHTAQLLHRGEVGPEVSVYLDAEGWQGLAPTLCDAETLLDFDAAAELSDLTWQLSYAGDATEWANGDRGYSCFVTRSAGDKLDASLLAKQ